MTIINLLAMSCSEQIVKKIYGGRLVLKDTHQYVHHLFTLYQDRKTKEQYFLRTVELPAFLHISDGIADLVSKKYQNLLAPTKIIPLDKNFQTVTYLLRVPQNIILLTNFLQVKRQCRQHIELEFFRKFLLFLMNSYQVIDNAFLPLYGINQIGLTDSNQFTLCDPSLYFRQEQSNFTNEPFGEWIQKFIREFFNLPLSQEEYQGIVRDKFQNNINILWPLIGYLLSGSATFDGTQAKLLPILSRMSEDVSTVTSSYMDVNEVFERGTKSIAKGNKVAFNKVGKIGRTLIIFIIIGILFGVAYFLIEFFNRKIACQQGFYLNQFNQCLICSDGCLRCEGSEPNRCMKCSINMYLVLDEEEDKQGYCLKECRGKLISLDVCVMEKKLILEEEAEESEISGLVHEDNVLID